MKIPATVVTGFLGAGKTTLIRHLLETANGRRIALIINEFGSLGVDRELLLGCGVTGCADGDVIELATGCICCTVADDFLPTIELLLDRPDPPEHIVIETSGLALPKPLLKAFAWPQVRTRVTVDGVLAVIDAPAVLAGTFASDPDAVGRQRAADAALDHTAALQELYEDQLAAADLVILNKFDLLDDAGRESVRRDIAERVDSAVKVIPTVQAAIAADIALGVGAAVEDALESRPSHHDADPDHDHDDFDAFVVDLGAVADPEALESRLRDVARAFDVLRIKGFVHVPGKDSRRVVQAVGRRVQGYYDRAWRAGEARASRLVFIAASGVDRDGIEAALGARETAGARARD